MTHDEIVKLNKGKFRKPRLGSVMCACVLTISALNIGCIISIMTLTKFDHSAIGSMVCALFTSYVFGRELV